jgi:hypothetical protein
LTSVYAGYDCLIQAVLLVNEDPSRLDLVTKWVYNDVARVRNMTPSGVDSAIRAAIRVCLRRNEEEVRRVCGVEGTPSVGKFIAALYRCAQEEAAGSLE